MSEADEDVTAARYQQLNERFYTADPGDYFRTRLSTLALVAGRRGDLLDLLKEGVEYGRIWAKADTNAEVEATGIERYVTIESQILLHHVAEALTRLFLAHVDSPPCPWFELSAEVDFGRFKRRVEAQLVKPRRRGALEEEAAFVLLGRRSPRPDEDAARWNDATENLARFLRVLATRWLKDSHVFNAMKHGLAVLPGTPSSKSSTTTARRSASGREQASSTSKRGNGRRITQGDERAASGRQLRDGWTSRRVSAWSRLGL